jgi:prepilin-type N-terminal cleavage/methylation domain-containing protein
MPERREEEKKMWERKHLSCDMDLQDAKNADSAVCSRPHAGFSLIELVLAIAILAVVSAMLGQILSASGAMYRKTIFYSELQKNSQMISKRLDTAIMNADSLQTGGSDTLGEYLYLGTGLPAQGSPANMGPLIWFDKQTHAVYYWESGTVTVDDKGLAAAIRKAMVETNAKQYLLGTDVESLHFEVPPESSQTRTVTYTLTLSHISGAAYTVTNRVTPRNIR